MTTSIPLHRNSPLGKRQQGFALLFVLGAAVTGCGPGPSPSPSLVPPSLTDGVYLWTAGSDGLLGAGGPVVRQTNPNPRTARVDLERDPDGSLTLVDLSSGEPPMSLAAVPLGGPAWQWSSSGKGLSSADLEMRVGTPNNLLPRWEASIVNSEGARVRYRLILVADNQLYGRMTGDLTGVTFVRGFTLRLVS